MKKFEDALFRLLQDLRTSANPFTSKEDDNTADMQAVLEFSKEWDFKDKYLRASADYDNLVKRTEKERAEWARTLVVGVLKELPPVIDATLNAREYAEKNSSLDMALKIIQEELIKILERRGGGLIIPKDGETFDTNIHRAIDFIESSDHTGHLIKGVYRCGYQVSGQIIRPAEVKVSLGRANSQ